MNLAQHHHKLLLIQLILVLDRCIGTHKLHPQCFITCAVNRKEDIAITSSMWSAITSFLVHLIFDPSVEDLIENVLIHHRYDLRITAFSFYK